MQAGRGVTSLLDNRRLLNLRGMNTSKYQTKEFHFQTFLIDAKHIVCMMDIKCCFGKLKIV